MSCLPRLALATPATGPDPSPACLAMLAGLTSLGWRVQHFRSRALPSPADAVHQISGLPGRHLDSWLMPPEVCCEVFARGSRSSDLAIVEGRLGPEGAPGPSAAEGAASGHLGPLIQALDLPTIAVVPYDRGASYHLPGLSPEVDAVILDGLDCPEEYDARKRLLELLTQRPVLGAVEALPETRAWLRNQPSDQHLPRELIGRLGASFLRFADLAALESLATSRATPRACGWLSQRPPRGLRVAYAQDEAFGGYYPDTLEMLEAFGAELLEFSPLRSEQLPESVDLVMIGCGWPDRHAEELAANLCLIASLKAHVCRQRRIYAEGGGAAYLGRNLILGDRIVPGAGILPYDAVLSPGACRPTPVARTLARGSWLGPTGTEVRGYRSSRWTFRPAPDPADCDCPSLSGSLTPEGDLYFRYQAVASLIHLHLAALPQVMDAFLGTAHPRRAQGQIRR